MTHNVYDRTEINLNGCGTETSKSRRDTEQVVVADGGQQSGLSKEEIADKFDVEFAKKPKRNSQHLVAPQTDETLCGVGLGTEVPRSKTPGPFDPICGNCRKQIEEGRSSPAVTDLRNWLAEEIEAMRDVDGLCDESHFSQEEIEALVSYIQSLKSKNK